MKSLYNEQYVTTTRAQFTKFTGWSWELRSGEARDLGCFWFCVFL